MRLETETYAVVSYEELEEAKRNHIEARKEFFQKHENFLITCLCNAGFANKKVRVKQTGVVGVLRVENSSFGSYSYPYEIKFYPLKKNGETRMYSMCVAQFNPFREQEIHQQLLNAFELVGDESAG